MHSWLQFADKNKELKKKKNWKGSFFRSRPPLVFPLMWGVPAWRGWHGLGSKYFFLEIFFFFFFQIFFQAQKENFPFIVKPSWCRSNTQGNNCNRKMEDFNTNCDFLIHFNCFVISSVKKLVFYLRFVVHAIFTLYDIFIGSNRIILPVLELRLAKFDLQIFSSLSTL